MSLTGLEHSEGQKSYIVAAVPSSEAEIILLLLTEALASCLPTRP